MKKIISLALSLMLMLTSMTVFASNEEAAFDALFNLKYLSGELDFEMAIKPNAPLPKFIDPDGSQAKMLESAKIAFHIKYNSNEDGKKVQSEMDMLMSIPFMDSMEMKYWIDMDLSDMEKPIYKMIMKTPVDEKYMYMDYAKNPGLPISAMTPASLQEIKSINDELTKSIDVSKLKVENKDGKYIVVIDESTIKELFKNVSTVMSKYFMKYFMITNTAVITEASSVGVIGGADGPTSVFVNRQPESKTVDEEKPEIEAIKVEYEKAVAEFFAKLDNVQLFDTNAIVIESVLNDKNLLQNQKITINVKTNIAELLGAFGVSEPAITKENSDLNVSLIMDFAYSKVNEQIDIVFPELTKDNSIDMFGGYSSGPRIDENKINVLVNGQIIDFDVEPIIQNDRVLVPIRAFLNTIGVNDDNIIYGDGDISIKRGDTVVNLKVGSNIAVVDGKEISLEMPVLVVEGRTLLPARFVAETFKYDVDWIPIRKGEDGPLSGGIVHLTTKRPEPRISFMIPSDSEAVDVEKLEKASSATGAEVNIMEVSKEHYREKTMLMLAAGEPAVIFNNNIDKEWLEKLAEQGAVAPLEDQIAKYAPNIQKYLDENPDFKSNITNGDGHIYIIPVLDNNKEETGAFFISITIKNPEMAIKLLDNLYIE